MKTKGMSVLTLRPDLSLQVALGDEVLDLNLGPSDAYTLAGLLMSALRERRADVGGDGDLVVIAFDQALAALATTQLLAQPDIKVSAENQQLAARALQHGFLGLGLLREQILKENHEQSKQH